MRKGALLALFGVFVAMLLVAVGCGGGDETTSTVTREEFRNQANKVCQRGALEREDLISGAQKLATEGGEIPDDAKEEVILTVIVDPYGKMIGELEELDLPRKHGEDYEALFKAMRISVQEARKEPEIAVQSVAQFEESNEMARKLGVENCAL